MSSQLFLLRDGENVTDLRHASFDKEDSFQTLLEKFPQLLTNLDGDDFRKWILIKREANYLDGEGESRSFSIDHLFLDEEGVPTLVEVKRASDTRARREVVAQLLDYAANAPRIWSVDILKNWFNETQNCTSEDSDSKLSEIISIPDFDPKLFWNRVSENLINRKLRLVIAADIVHPQLERIVEFLNEQMNPTIFIALELRLFRSGNDQILAPRVIGLTTRARDKKPNSSPKMSIEEWYAQDGINPKISYFVDRLKEKGAEAVARGSAIILKYNHIPFAYCRVKALTLSFFMLRKNDNFKEAEDRNKLLSIFNEHKITLSNKNSDSGEPTIAWPNSENNQDWDKIILVFEAIIVKMQS